MLTSEIKVIKCRNQNKAVLLTNPQFLNFLFFFKVLKFYSKKGFHCKIIFQENRNIRFICICVNSVWPQNSSLAEVGQTRRQNGGCTAGVHPEYRGTGFKPPTTHRSVVCTRDLTGQPFDSIDGNCVASGSVFDSSKRIIILHKSHLYIITQLNIHVFSTRGWAGIKNV